MVGNTKKHGFTIVELLIVIVVIGILAAITMVAFGGAQNKSRQAKIQQDLTSFEKAIRAARQVNGGTALRFITNSTATAGACVSQPSNTELADKTVAASCWTSYNNALNTISNVSGVNIRNLADPWGRPYFLDENEQEGVSLPCGNGRDRIGVYQAPHVTGNWSSDNSRNIPYITPGC